MNLKKRLLFLFSFFVLIAIISSCSTKKDRALNRGWHQLNTKYNVVFNGNESFSKSWSDLQSGYYEDFWHILPIERLKVENQYAFNIDADADSPFAIAEEKAVKAIKKHSMLIGDEERNTQMVEAYLLLGKARYYDQRFVPAYEAFNFIIKKYRASNLLNKVRIWKERTNIRLGNEYVAIENLKRLLKYRNLKPQEFADANATMAQAYMNTDSVTLAMNRLKLAKNSTRNLIEKARYGFILGQLYTAVGQIDSAKTQYDEIVELNRRVPRAFWIHSKLRSLRFEYSSDMPTSEHLIALDELAKKWSNREFLDKIYYQKAVVLFESKEDSSAVAYVNKSLRINREDFTLQGMSYELLADYYFNTNQYLSAKTYYDSLLPYIPNPSKRYRSTQKRILKITDVAYFEEKINSVDSILRLAKLPKEAQLKQVQKHIATLVKKDSLKTVALERAQEKQVEDQQRQISQTKDQFYFYNPALIERGQRAFKMKWGDRALVDNWRWENKTKQSLAVTQNKDVEQAKQQSQKKKNTYDPEFYLSRIPQSPKSLESLQHELKYAHFRLGALYKENFDLNDLALDHLLLASKDPSGTNIKVPALYEMYKIYQEELELSKANSVKNEIIQSFPETVYAKVLLRPDTASELIEQQRDSAYIEVYDLMKNQEYQKVISRTTQHMESLTQANEAAKWSYLKAQAIGKLYGLVAYKKELFSLVKTYPGTEASKGAEEFLKNAQSLVQQSDFGEATPGDHWKLAVLIKRDSTANDSLIGHSIRALFKDNLSHLRFSKDSYTPEENFYVVHGFSRKSEAVRFSKNKIFSSEPITDGEFFVILASHYRKVQLYKNIVAYKTANKALKR